MDRRRVAAVAMAGWTLFTIVVLVGLANTGMARYDDVGTWAYLVVPALAAALGWEGLARARREAA